MTLEEAALGINTVLFPRIIPLLEMCCGTDSLDMYLEYPAQLMTQGM